MDKTYKKNYSESDSAKKEPLVQVIPLTQGKQNNNNKNNLKTHERDIETNRAADKFKLFLQLTHNYSKKLKHLSLLLRKFEDKFPCDKQLGNKERGKALPKTSPESKENLLCELISTIEKFNATINNPLLIENLFLSNRISNFKESDERLFNDSLLETKCQDNSNEVGGKNAILMQAIEKLEIQVKRLQEQNDSLANKSKAEVYYFS